MKRATWSGWHGVLLVLGAAVCAPAGAGGTPAPAMVLPVEQVVTLAKKVEHVAADHGARVFLVARVGRPPSELPDGIEYTHVSFGVYSAITTADGRVVPGYSIYNLYQDEDDPAHSSLVVDFPADFMAPIHVARAAVLIPSPALQQRLLEVFASGDWRKVHVRDYSVLANPHDARFQNCTEFVLDVLNSAIYRTTDMTQLKAGARAYFHAQRVRISPLKLFFATIFKPDVTLADQKRGVETATFQTIADYLGKYGMVDKVLTVEL